MAQERDFNKEFSDDVGRKYGYNFDYDVMQPFMIRAFEPFFMKGKLLELGSFKGEFTEKYLPYFKDVTCVEASSEAVTEATERLGEKAKIYTSLFEEIDLPSKYDTIVMTHVLEHVVDPIQVLRRVNNEWLSEGGRFLLACPNANAASRQIAVKMGIIPHNTAVTEGEAAHGHQITYTLDTLERDARTAGLKVTYRSGVFFKALANFQWDKILDTDVISKEYLDGCYQLGQQYPDLCSSIFLVCEKG